MPTSATVTAECPRHDSFEHDRGSFDAAINETEEKEADRKLTQIAEGVVTQQADNKSWRRGG